MQYFGTKLSENISRREPEGYLLCLNVPVARSGTQEYLPEELGITVSEPVTGYGAASACHPERSRRRSRRIPPVSGLLEVLRPESEVFSPETMASFEGMPVTNDHPPDGVDVENIRRLQMGHAHNIRRGTGSESDLLLADLIITDPCLIDAVLNGKREISCGYTYELHEENGQYIQRKIRGNHIAVVDAGRAGPRVSIKDLKIERSTKMKKSLTKLLARMARDGDVETVAEFIEEMMGEPAGIPTDAEESPEEEPVTVEVPENREVTIDENALSGILQRLDQLITLLTAALDPAPAADDDPAEEMAEAVEEVAEVIEEVLETEGDNTDPEVSETIEENPSADSCDPDPEIARDALRAALLAVRPALAKMSPAKRRKISADIAANLRRNRGAADARVYAALAAGKPAPRPLADLGKRIMASRNPNYKH